MSYLRKIVGGLPGPEWTEEAYQDAFPVDQRIVVNNDHTHLDINVRDGKIILGVLAIPGIGVNLLKPKAEWVNRPDEVATLTQDGMSTTVFFEPEGTMYRTTYPNGFDPKVVPILSPKRRVELLLEIATLLKGNKGYF